MSTAEIEVSPKDQDSTAHNNIAATQNQNLKGNLRLLTGLLIASLCLTLVSLLWSAHSQDKIALANARHLAGTALQLHTSSLQKTLTDYTWWDEAYEKSVESFDNDFFDVNFAHGDYLRDAFGITGSFIVGPDNKILRHMHNSKLVENAAQLDTAVYFDGGINKLIRTARKPVDGAFHAAAGFIKLEGKYYIATARVIHPSSDEMIEKLAAAPRVTSVAAFMRPLDTPLLAEISEGFGLQNLRLVGPGDPAGKLPLETTKGERFGALTWQIDRPSRYVLTVTLPGFLALIVCFALLGWFLVKRLNDGRDRMLQAITRAQVADRSKTEFLANMSHELRTPLNSIIGFSEMMKDQTYGPLGDRRYLDYSTNIHDSGAHLLGIINDVLELSKVEAGKFVLQEVEIDIRDTVELVTRLIEPRAAERGIAVATDIAPDLPGLIADDRALKQILLNLLSNAVKFTPAAGDVSVRAGCNTDGDMELVVSDSGHGIPEDQLSLVMQPFHQVNSALARTEGGTGLGLPLSASLVALHDGQMQIESVVNKGTTITITLPQERLIAKTVA